MKIARDPSGVRAVTVDRTIFRGRWPTARIAVAARVPADRTILLRHVGPLVVVVAPPATRARLRYLYSVTCQTHPGVLGTGNFGWDPLPTATISDPGCPGADERWSVAVGAPGYAIATATFPGRGGLP